MEELAGLTDFSHNSYTSRADFIRWGLDIVKDYPVNGAGAGGWNALYHQYQDYLFFTTEAHNHFIQVWVEAGTIGLLAFLAIWILFFRAAYHTYSRARTNRNTDQQILIGGTFTAAVALGIHAAIDFDLSLASIALVLWILFALVSTAQSINNQDKPTPSKFAHLLPVANIGIAVLCTLLLFIYGCSYYSAHKHAITASTALHAVSSDKSEQEQNELFQTALKHYEKATQLNSLDAEYHADLAYVYALTYLSLKESGHQLAGQAYQQAASAVEKAAGLKPYDPKVRSSLLNTANMLGEFSLTLQQAEGPILSNPNDINGYEALVKVLAAGLEYYQQEGDKEQTAQLAQKIVDAQLKLEEQKAKINPNRTWHGSPLRLSPEAQYHIAQANYLLGNYEESLTIYQTASPELFKEVADENTPQPVLKQFAWYAASLYKTGKTSEADNIAQQLKTLDAQVYSTYEKLINQEPLKTQKNAD
jgi:tetratricopeptide (TPR) repeat protein